LRRYLRRRTGTELTRATTRSLTDPLAAWATKRIRLEGRPFSFEGHEYLRAIYDDTSPHLALSKAAQIGGTTYGILRSLHACLQGLNVGYFFPTRTDVIEFSKSRVGPLIEDNPFLARAVRDTDTAGLKRIGDAHLYLRGMQSNVGMKSIPVDMLVFDELDEAAPEAKSLARERLSHSDYRRIIELSNPSLPDYGIDAVYQISDQRHWTLKCSSCGQWTSLEKEFPRKKGEDVRIILPRPDGTFYRACRHCAAELDLAAGEWVADYPGREIHGYRISQLFSSKVDPGEILREYLTTHYIDRFYNMKIGIPWADLERRLDVGTVLALCRTQPLPEKSEEWCVMGVDTGKLLHVVVLGEDEDDKHLFHLIHLGIYHDYSELDAVIERMKVQCCVIDALPEIHATRAFAGRHPGTVFMNFFNENQRGAPAWNYGEQKVEENRTEALDASRAAVREKKLTLPPQDPLIRAFAEHMSRDAKILDEDPDTGAKKYRYVRTGEDHFSLAFTYAWMAALRLAGSRYSLEDYGWIA
jgi:hypothetical protein